jgi:hypothetical protein
VFYLPLDAPLLKTMLATNKQDWLSLVISDYNRKKFISNPIDKAWYLLVKPWLAGVLDVHPHTKNTKITILKGNLSI